MVLRRLKTGERLGAHMEQPELRSLPSVPGGELVSFHPAGMPVGFDGGLAHPKPRSCREQFLRWLLRRS